MPTWAVYHLIHVKTPHQHRPRLVVDNVPDGAEVTEDLLERAGFQFGEFDIPWANHILAKVDLENSPSDLIARIRQGKDYTRITYEALLKAAQAEL